MENTGNTIAEIEVKLMQFFSARSHRVRFAHYRNDCGQTDSVAQQLQDVFIGAEVEQPHFEHFKNL